jgi:PAS domain S-box-containing protein
MNLKGEIMGTLLPLRQHDRDDIDLMLQFAGIGLCITRQNVIQRCNPLFGEMFGYRADELAANSVACLYPSCNEFNRSGARWLARLLESGSGSDEQLMRRRDGSLFSCRVIGRALHPDHPFDCAVWTVEDISTPLTGERALTGREKEVAQLLVAGKSSKEIGKILKISPRTADSHRARMLQKFAARSRVELITKLLGSSSLAMA